MLSEGRSTAEASEESGSEGGSKEEMALEGEKSGKWGILDGTTGEGMDRKERGNMVGSVYGNMWILWRKRGRKLCKDGLHS